MTVYLGDETATLALGRRLGLTKALSERRLILFLSGDLGVGKTTFVRGLLRGLGYRGSVKSPTYTLVEPYQLSDVHIYHIDLYRLNDPEELEYTGIRDSFSDSALFLIEWPDKARSALPNPDLELFINRRGHGRELHIRTISDWGARIASEVQIP